MKMTKSDKRILARQWIAQLKERMLLAIDKAPPEWGTLEFRQLFADLATEVSLSGRYNLTRERATKYESGRIVHNI